MVDENKSPADRLLDVFVFAPAGLALVAAEEFPKLVDKGRHHVDGQVRTARLVGQIAVQMGRRQLTQFVQQHRPTAAAPAKSAAPTSAATTDRATTTRPPRPVAPYGGGGPERAASRSGEVTPLVSVPVNGSASASALAIPGYDSLSASQVVQRLGGLSRGELLDVRAHEQAHRHRRTILSRVEQLLAGADVD